MKIKRPFMKIGGLLFLCGLLISSNALSQRSIKGTVYDGTSNDPLVGATVILKGTTNGTTTGIDGTFSMNVPGPESILVFSFIGYEPQEMPVLDNQSMDVHLILSTQQLEELVVIGYGTVKKSDLTGSVAVVTADNLNRIPSSTFDKALQGKAAGVLVTQSSGQPGVGPSIMIRGIGSINSGSNPIYIVDGIQTGSISNINPNDIETIQVLKDASASAIYGADGGNGVVILTTKRGKAGKTSVSYSGYTSINRVPKKLDLMNASEYAQFFNDIYTADNQVPDEAYTDAFRQFYYGSGWEKGTDWQDAITRTGYTQNHYLNISGGSEYSNFSLSAGYYKESGILRSTGADRYNLRANSDFKIGKFIKVGESLSVSKSSIQNPDASQRNSWSNAAIASPLMKIFNPNNKGGYEGPQVSYDFNGNPVDNTGGNDKTNPRAELDLPKLRNENTNILAILYAELKPVEWLSYKITPSIELYNGTTSNWTPSYNLGVRSNARASLVEASYNGLTWSLDNQVTLNKSFGDHTFLATAVYNVYGSNSKSNTLTGLGFNYEQLHVMQQADELQSPYTYLTPYRRLSTLARFQYDYKGKYLLTSSIRKDGVSRMGPSNRYGVFPSFSLAWKLNEDFLQNVQQINLLKLRIGYGKTGNSSIGDFRYDDFLTDPTQFSSVFGVNQTIAPGTFIFYSFANPNILWEAAAMTNFGFDLNVFNNKVQLSAEYYIKNQSNLLVQKQVPMIFGRSGDGSNPYVNLGKIQNSGFELAASYKKMEGVFTYSANLTLTTMKNVVKYVPSSTALGNNITKEGQTIGSLYGYIAERIITPADFDSTGKYMYAMPTIKPAAGDIKFKDLNHDGLIDDKDRTIIGKPLPDMLIGFGFDSYFKGFDFSFFFNGMINYQVFDAQRASLMSFNAQDRDHNKLREFAQNYYKSDRTSDKYVRADLNNNNANDRISTWWIENATFIRLKDIQIGYSLPVTITSALGITKARFYSSAMNLFILTNYKGRDPEGGATSNPLLSGTDNGTYPTPRTFTFGLQVEF